MEFDIPASWSLVPLGPTWTPLETPSLTVRATCATWTPSAAHSGVGVVTGPVSGVWAGPARGAPLVATWPGGTPTGLWPSRVPGRSQPAGTVVPVEGPGVELSRGLLAGTASPAPSASASAPPAEAWEEVGWGATPPPVPWEEAPGLGVVADMMVAVAANTGASPPLVGLLATGFLSLPLASRVVVAMHAKPASGIGTAISWEEHAALFALGLAPSGLGKSPIFDALFAPFLAQAARVDRDSREAAAAHNARVAAARAVLKRGTADPVDLEDAARVAALGEARPRPLFIADPTPAALIDRAQRYPSVSLVSQEATSFLQQAVRDGQAEVQGLLHLYAGEAYVGVARIGRETSFAPGARLRGGVVGAIQPGAFHGLAQVEAYSDLGLLARFLYTAWDERYADPDRLLAAGAPISPEVRGGWSAIVARLYAIPEVERAPDGLDLGPLRPVQVCPAGTAALLAFRHRLRRLTGIGGALRSLEAWCNKAHGQAARLAGIWTMVAEAQRPTFAPGAAGWSVPLGYVHAAIELVEAHLLPHAAAVHLLAAWPRGSEAARDLWVRMAGVPRWTWTEIEARQGLVPSAPAQIQAALDALVARGFLRPGPGSGRERVYWPNPRGGSG